VPGFWNLFPGIGMVALTAKQPTMAIISQQLTIKDFFDDYAKALLSYSAENIAHCYQAPLAV
jgi:hypothetical protein